MSTYILNKENFLVHSYDGKECEYICRKHGKIVEGRGTGNARRYTKCKTECNQLPMTQEYCTKHYGSQEGKFENGVCNIPDPKSKGFACTIL